MEGKQVLFIGRVSPVRNQVLIGKQVPLLCAQLFHPASRTTATLPFTYVIKTGFRNYSETETGNAKCKSIYVIDGT